MSEGSVIKTSLTGKTGGREGSLDYICQHKS